MTVLTHAAVGLGISTYFPHVSPAWAVVFSLAPDLDHLLFLRSIRPRIGGMRHARTFLHELLGGVLALGVGAVVQWRWPPYGAMWILCVVVHLVCDFLNGYSRPFLGIRSAPPVEMGARLWVRVAQELAVGSSFLWLFLTRSGVLGRG